MKQTAKVFTYFSIAYLVLLIIGISFFHLFFGMKFDDLPVISNIFVWSATLFAPISAFFIFNGWKTQHNKAVERDLAETSSLNLNEIKEALGQIYNIVYLNKITHPHFYPVNNKTMPEYINKNILELNRTALNCYTVLAKDLGRLSRTNAHLKEIFDNYENEFNKLHSHLFYFIDLKMQRKMPNESPEDTKQYFIEIYDDYHSFRIVSESVDENLDKIIFI